MAQRTAVFRVTVSEPLHACVQWRNGSDVPEFRRGGVLASEIRRAPPVAQNCIFILPSTVFCAALASSTLMPSSTLAPCSSTYPHALRGPGEDLEMYYMSGETRFVKGPALTALKIPPMQMKSRGLRCELEYR